MPSDTLSALIASVCEAEAIKKLHPLPWEYADEERRSVVFDAEGRVVCVVSHGQMFVGPYPNDVVNALGELIARLFPLCDAIEELQRELQSQLAASNAIFLSLEWTGDGYEWNPTHGHYVEAPHDAVARGAAAYRAELERLQRENAELRATIKGLRENGVPPAVRYVPVTLENPNA